MNENPPNFPFIDNAHRVESREQPQKVYNVMEARGLPSRPEMRMAEMTGENAVVKGFKPLTSADCPNVVIGIPHAGESAPLNIRGRLTEEGDETMALLDLATPEIFQSKKIPWAQFGITRFVVDPNRSPEFDINKKTEHGKPPGTILWSEGIRFGPMYKEGTQPTPEEVEALAERYYLPYYNTIMGAVGTLIDRRKDKSKERVLIIDGHSFPVTDDLKPYYTHYGIEDPKKLPMFILGTREGEGCDDDVVEAFEQALQNNYDNLPPEDRELISKDVGGPLFIRNHYMKGVHNVKFWGAAHKEHGINALQIECNERAYMDRPKGGAWKDFSYNEKKQSILHELIEKTALDLDPLLKATARKV
ncbi:MAG: N-formylglutamate amidohydrolase [bacterium]|nr:N-formylglutamate amidohydrolase [bacterium]